MPPQKHLIEHNCYRAIFLQLDLTLQPRFQRLSFAPLFFRRIVALDSCTNDQLVIRTALNKLPVRPDHIRMGVGKWHSDEHDDQGLPAKASSDMATFRTNRKTSKVFLTALLVVALVSGLEFRHELKLQRALHAA
eukprot:CAMPEP_0184541834 /NCGR_PEP_ID=MMETSP0199_2-20130426/1628_1 /TAXON_ID=1112570 /ORGANISM="Thraustochytrium sp., Strain LLF1b" /LENGTH=134 /DNA_ID=CAMNT_0026935583 /DNA_START=647 /DNA_END=1047 /DNA_ORIENTATION=-